MNIFDEYSRQQQAEPSAARDWDCEQMAEQKYQQEEYRNEPSRGEIPFASLWDNTLWQDYQENWVEITEFVGPKKPVGRAMQIGLFDEVA